MSPPVVRDNPRAVRPAALINGDKWTAFLLSLVVPGTGQLFARSWWCLPWFVAAAVVGVLPGLVDAASALASPGLRLALLATVALTSAEHAKRCLEPRRRSRVRPRVRSRVICHPLRGSRVHVQMELDVPRHHAEVWATVADLPTFGCIDPFHRRVLVMGPQLQAGVDLVLEHCAFGFTRLRFGRLLKWRDGHGYAFSDLSRRGHAAGFPHVFFVSVEPAAGDPVLTRVRIDVRGKWTAQWVSRSVARLWLWYVMSEHARLLRAAM